MTPARLALVAAAGALVLTGCSTDGDTAKSTGTATASGPPSAQTVTVGMNDKLRFVPNQLRAVVGSLTIAVRNEGRIPHNLVFDTAGVGSTERIDGGRDATLTVRFPKAGTYRFECTFHPGMNGQVVVTEARS